MSLLFVESILLYASVECAVGDAQFLRSLLAVATVAFEGFLYHLTTDVAKVQTLVLFVLRGCYAISYLLGLHVLIRTECGWLQSVYLLGSCEVVECAVVVNLLADWSSRGADRSRCLSTRRESYIESRVRSRTSAIRLALWWQAACFPCPAV